MIFFNLNYSYILWKLNIIVILIDLIGYYITLFYTEILDKLCITYLCIFDPNSPIYLFNHLMDILTGFIIIIFGLILFITYRKRFDKTTQLDKVIFN